MERKIGEIFEYNGEWYQCVKGDMYDYCKGCPSFENLRCTTLYGNKDCWLKATCEKLEKVGETYEKRVSDGTFSTFQKYRVYNSVILPKEPYIYCNFIDGTIEIEIKQKEDMEEKKLNLKPFDIQKAREGKPVCTRDGRKARVLCYDFKQNEEYPILVAVENKDGKECALLYSNDGISEMYKSSNNELVMCPVKRTGYINIYDNNRVCKQIFETEGEAKIAGNSTPDKYIQTIKIEWEE